ncbi:unnamed protein product [Moneuplotes crassus]|uniref:Uncharacterized protein n=1 Tax=Euplotes crassus TaxID=5936 RepID=A0AAD1UEF8_EUPCR|nr:unnamed protein product [Moneuplotes crassus]
MEEEISRKEQEERSILKKSDRIYKDLYSAPHQNSCYLKEFSKKDILFLIEGSIPCGKFAKRIHPIAASKLIKIVFSCFQNRDKNILNFILCCFPRKVNYLRMYGSSELPKSKNYFPELIKNSCKVQDKVNFSDFIINFRQLQKIVSAFRHVKSLNIISSIISVPKVPDFTHALDNTRISELIFDSCGVVNRSNWANNPQEFTNLIEGLSKSQDLKQALHYFSIKNCNLKETPTRKILNTHNFLNTTLIL